MFVEVITYKFTGPSVILFHKLLIVYIYRNITLTLVRVIIQDIKMSNI